MKRILITNDDGFDSPGLHVLMDAVKDLGQVIVVAPTTEKSACGHGLTLTQPLRFIELDDDFYKLDDGTPTDCVYLALHALFDEKIQPDLVISGINKGANMGEDVTYSGTAAGAMEAVLHGIPSIAFSQVYGDIAHMETWDYALAKQTATTLVKKVLEGSFPLPDRHFMNVNIPPVKPEACKGIKATKQGYRLYNNTAQVNRNPRGEEYYWLGLHPLRWMEDEKRACDFDAITDHYVSVSPIRVDLTAHEHVETLARWL